MAHFCRKLPRQANTAFITVRLLRSVECDLDVRVVVEDVERQ